MNTFLPGGVRFARVLLIASKLFSLVFIVLDMAISSGYSMICPIIFFICAWLCLELEKKKKWAQLACAAVLLLAGLAFASKFAMALVRQETPEASQLLLIILFCTGSAALFTPETRDWFASATEPPTEAERRTYRKTIAWLLFGCSFVTVLIVSIYLPGYISYRKRQFDISANACLESAYGSSRRYFTDNPQGSVTIADMERYGFSQITGVTLTIVDGKQDSLKLNAWHEGGGKTYAIDYSGKISFENNR